MFCNHCSIHAQSAIVLYIFALTSMTNTHSSFECQGGYICAELAAYIDERGLECEL